MDLLEMLRNELQPDVYTKVLDTLGDDFDSHDIDVVPRTRLNEVIKQRNQLRKQLGAGGTTQPTSKPASTAGENEDESVDIESLRESLQNTLRAAWEQEQQTREENLRIEFAVLNQLREDGAIDPELAFTQLDRSKITRKDGKLEGYQEQCDALREAKSFLFKQRRNKRDTADTGTGKDTGEFGSETPGSEMTREKFLQLSYKEQLAFKQTYPDAFAKLLNSF